MRKNFYFYTQPTYNSCKRYIRVYQQFPWILYPYIRSKDCIVLLCFTALPSIEQKKQYHDTTYFDESKLKLELHRQTLCMVQGINSNVNICWVKLFWDTTFSLRFIFLNNMYQTLYAKNIIKMIPSRSNMQFYIRWYFLNWT